MKQSISISLVVAIYLPATILATHAIAQSSADLAKRSLDLIRSEDPTMRKTGLTGLTLSLGIAGETGAEIESTLIEKAAKEALSNLQKSGTDDERRHSAVLLSEYNKQLGLDATVVNWVGNFGETQDFSLLVEPGAPRWISAPQVDNDVELLFETSCPAEVTEFTTGDEVQYRSGFGFRQQLASDDLSRLRLRPSELCPGDMNVAGRIFANMIPWPERPPSGDSQLRAGQRYEISWDEDAIMSARIPVKAGHIYHAATLNSADGTDPLLEFIAPDSDENVVDDDSGFAPLESSVDFLATKSGNAKIRVANLDEFPGRTELVVWAEKPRQIQVGEIPLWLKPRQVFLLATEPGRHYSIEAIDLSENADPFLVARSKSGQVQAADDDGGMEPLAARIELVGNGEEMYVELRAFRESSVGRLKLQIKSPPTYATINNTFFR